MNVNHTEKTIGTVFHDHYVVPEFQREYVWGEENVEQLLTDLLDAYSANSNKAYYLGTIVTYKADECFELIDGQQRLTTFFLILCALKRIYIENNESTLLFDNLICSPVILKNGTVQIWYRLRLQYDDAIYHGQNDYLECIDKGLPKPSDLSLSGSRLFAAYKVILTFMDEHFSDFSDLQKFVAFLINSTCFIRLETEDINDALKIFETINQRGKGLDPMDLLKNMVFSQVKRDDFKNLNIKWREITETLESLEEKPLRFLRYFIMANYDTTKEPNGILREDRIYYWLKDNNDQCHYKEHPFKFVQKMIDNVNAYKSYMRPDNADNGNGHLKYIPSLAGSSYRLHLMLMLSAYNMEEDALTKFKNILESVVYYTVINKITTHTTERTFAVWCKRIRTITTMDELDQFLADTVIPTINEWKKDNESNFLRLGLGSLQQYRIKFILARITGHIDALALGKSCADDLSQYLDSKIEIEHIMPQTCDVKSDYNVTDEEFPVYVNRLGNLTLLENSINKSIHNSSYDVKSEAYKKSNFRLTYSISELVDQGKNTAITRTNQLLNTWSEWSKESIDERQSMLYDLSEQIWNLK